jgi:hypothetical protein
MDNLKSAFHNLGYKPSSVEREMLRAKSIPRHHPSIQRKEHYR